MFCIRWAFLNGGTSVINRYLSQNISRFQKKWYVLYLIYNFILQSYKETSGHPCLEWKSFYTLLERTFNIFSDHRVIVVIRIHMYLKIKLRDKKHIQCGDPFVSLSLYDGKNACHKHDIYTSLKKKVE